MWRSVWLDTNAFVAIADSCNYHIIFLCFFKDIPQVITKDPINRYPLTGLTPHIHQALLQPMSQRNIWSFGIWTARRRPL
jgi:hypothetical protein